MDYSESIQSKGGKPLVCSSPACYDEKLHPAVDEALALRAAYERAVKSNARTSVCEVISADQLPGMLEKLIKIAEGEP